MGIMDAFRVVHYFNNGSYYKIDEYNKHVLLNKKGYLKKCLIVDVTKNKIYYGAGELRKEDESLKYISNKKLVDEVLSSLRYKFFKRIKQTKV